MRKIGIDLNVDYPLCHHEEESIDNLCGNYDLAKSIWSNINVSCQTPINSDKPFIGWLEYIGRINHGITKYFIILLKKLLLLHRQYRS